MTMELTDLANDQVTIKVAGQEVQVNANDSVKTASNDTRASLESTNTNASASVKQVSTDSAASLKSVSDNANDSTKAVLSDAEVSVKAVNDKTVATASPVSIQSVKK